jgi:hypothetical protein
MKTLMIILLLTTLTLLIGCAQPDQNILDKLAALEARAAALKQQTDNLVNDIKTKGITPESITQLLSMISQTNDIRNQITDIQKESTAGGATNWIYILVSIISGLTGYPVMRAVRLNFSNSAVSPPKS